MAIIDAFVASSPPTCMQMVHPLAPPTCDRRCRFTSSTLDRPVCTNASDASNLGSTRASIRGEVSACSTRNASMAGRFDTARRSSTRSTAQVAPEVSSTNASVGSATRKVDQYGVVPPG